MLDKLAKNKKLEKAKELFQEAVTRDHKWQREAREDFLFRDGQQWTATEKRILEEEMRPVLTFNLTKSSIDLIMGMNEDNKVVHRCSPVDPTDGFLSEVLNDISEWVQETHNFVDEEENALESGAICGRGYVAVDFVPDPKRFGEIVMSEYSPPVSEIHFDPAARRKDLSDASYITWDKWISESDFRIRYPKITEKRLNKILEVSGLDAPESVQPVTEKNIFEENVGSSSDTSDYSKPMDMEYFDKSKDMIRVIHMEYWCPIKRHFGFNPESGAWVEFDGKNLKDIREEYEATFKQEFIFETLMDKRVYWLEFTGNEVLFDDVSPLPYQGFSIVPLFVYSDVSRRTANHYGIVRLMKDPQREVNKRWSQALNMLNQQVQPGVYAETDAFVDANQAEQSLKEAGSITYVNSGVLSGGRIKERTVPKFPDAPMQMEQFSQDIMKKITGINPDLLGQDRGRQEPGVVIRLRQQQGMVLLKPLFRSFNNMKKELFKRQLSIIMAYMPDEQVLRILGDTERYQIDPNTGTIYDMSSVDQQTGAPTISANLRDVRNLEYNIVSEEAPGNMSKRMLELSALMEMMGQGFPVPPEQIIEKMSISESEKMRWIRYIQQQQESQAQQAQEQMQVQVGLEEKKLQIDERAVQMEFLTDMAKIKQMVHKDQLKMEDNVANRQLQEKQGEAELQKMLADLAHQYKKFKMEQEAEATRIAQDEEAARLKMRLDTAAQTMDLRNKSRAQEQDLRFKREQQAEKIKQAKQTNAIKVKQMKQMAEMKKTKDQEGDDD